MCMIWNRLLAVILILFLGIALDGAAESGNSDGSVDDQRHDNSVTAQTSLFADTQHLAGYHKHWHSTSLLQHLTNGQSELGLWALLRFEYQSRVNALTDLYSSWRSHISAAPIADNDNRLGHYHHLISTILILWSATAIFAVPLHLAMLSTTLILHINELITR